MRITTTRTIATGLLAVHLCALEPGKPSKTSIWAMAARALGARDFDPSVRNPDWLAERLLGPAEREIIADHPIIKALDGDYRHAYQDASIHSVVRGLLVRTRFIDERLKHALDEGATQVVILGAGFDTRAYRFRDLLRNAKVFEVDYGPTQEYKKRRIKDVLGGLPENVVYSAIDFTRERLIDVLRKAGYRRDRKVFFSYGKALVGTSPKKPYAVL